MHLLIDAGNTRIKWQLITEEYKSEKKSDSGSLQDLSEFIKTLNAHEIDTLVAAVNQTEELKKLLDQSRFRSVVAASSQASQLGVCNSYVHPERMGVDRWLAMIAAFKQRKASDQNKGVIVVDAGSALTIDIVSVNGNHQGGYIVPGLLMAQQTLFANTERVMQYDEDSVNKSGRDQYKKLGNNTIQCVEYGVINQMIALVKQVNKEYLDYEIFFTGGDGELLAGYLGTGTVDKDLVLKGLWQVRN
jgi:type III pantothenate kinase